MPRRDSASTTPAGPSTSPPQVQRPWRMSSTVRLLFSGCQATRHHSGSPFHTRAIINTVISTNPGIGAIAPLLPELANIDQCCAHQGVPERAVARWIAGVGHHAGPVQFGAHSLVCLAEHDCDAFLAQ